MGGYETHVFWLLVARWNEIIGADFSVGVI